MFNAESEECKGFKCDVSEDARKKRVVIFILHNFM